MLRQVIPYHHIINNRRQNNQLAGMIFRNAPVVKGKLGPGLAIILLTLFLTTRGAKNI
jgi:hypothetical protein